MTIKTRIVRIGNSQGIRVPRPLLDQARLRNRQRRRASRTGAR